jgi:hypothetical protein
VAVSTSRTEAPTRGDLVSPPPWYRRGLLREALLVGVGYVAYILVRDSQHEHLKPAFENARSVHDIEHPLGLTWIEHQLNNLVAHHHALGLVTGYYYSILHPAVTVAVLVWLFVRQPLDYRILRTGLVVASLLALVIFWQYPLAPPRLSGDGYVDVIDQVRVWGSWSSETIKNASDQYAAMPSLHTAWAVWCGWALASRSRSRVLRIAGICYPLATVFVIVSTGNHYIVDAVAGAALMALSLILAPALVGVTGAVRIRLWALIRPQGNGEPVQHLTVEQVVADPSAR